VSLQLQLPRQPEADFVRRGQTYPSLEEVYGSHQAKNPGELCRLNIRACDNVALFAKRIPRNIYTCSAILRYQFLECMIMFVTQMRSTTPRSGEITPAICALKSSRSPPRVATRSREGFAPSSFSMFVLARAYACFLLSLPSASIAACV
jgi:hypothetical protein